MRSTLFICETITHRMRIRNHPSEKTTTETNPPLKTGAGEEEKGWREGPLCFGRSLLQPAVAAHLSGAAVQPAEHGAHPQHHKKHPRQQGQQGGVGQPEDLLRP
eukprot:RCo022279